MTLSIPAMIPKFRIALFSLCLLISSVFIAWVAMAQINFAYPLLHSVMGIDEHVAKYGPQNRYRHGFEHTDKTEHERLFAAIVDAIHNNGEGLDKLIYHKSDGQPVRALLRKPEIIHLQDVSHVINAFYLVSCFAILFTSALVLVFKLKNIALPSIKQQIIGILSFSGVCLALVLIIGPVKVFYALHVLIFPDNHQWFFFYQESLMTVLMKAPDLFGAIAGIIAVFGIIIYLAINQFIHKKIFQTKKMGR